MNELTLETQEQYYEYISKIGKGCQNIADKIREGNMEIAINSIIELSEGLTWLLAVEDYMLNNQYKIESSTIKASEFLNDINNALELQDYVLVADLLEYEIKPIFKATEKWQFTKMTN